MADIHITLQYNTERDQIVTPEYGRHIQKIIQRIASVPSKEARNQQAKKVIAIMENLSPEIKNLPDFQRKLWDQLFIMSNFELDIDSPFPKPTPESVAKRPDRINYPQKSPKYRFYGYNIIKMIEVCSQYPEGKVKNNLKMAIAHHMKKNFLKWNNESVDDSVIFEHLKELSHGKIDLTQSDNDLSGVKNNTTYKRNKNNRKTNFSSRKKNFSNNNSFHKKKNNNNDGSVHNRRRS